MMSSMSMKERSRHRHLFPDKVAELFVSLWFQHQLNLFLTVFMNVKVISHVDADRFSQSQDPNSFSCVAVGHALIVRRAGKNLSYQSSGQAHDGWFVIQALGLQ